MALNAHTVPVTHYMQNCSIVWCSETREAAVIDPGGDVGKLTAALNELNLQLSKILLTHGHLDHVGGTAELKAALSLPVIGPHEADRFWIDNLAGQSKMMGFVEPASFTPDQWLQHGDTVSVGKEVLEVIHCPGHTPGHVVFYSKSTNLAFVGDVLFHGSIGRTDFPQGNHETLIASIRERLWPLGDGVRFVPGHGPGSDFGEERRNNPFVADARFG